MLLLNTTKSSTKFHLGLELPLISVTRFDDIPSLWQKKIIWQFLGLI